MSRYAEHYRFRSELVERLQRDVMGPVGGDAEMLTDTPMATYVTGVLFPRRKPQEVVERERAENDNSVESAELAVDEVPDSGVALANVQRPSSMGLTFAVNPDVSERIIITPAAAVYDPVDSQGNPVTAQRAERRSIEEQDLRWYRHQVEAEPIDLDITKPRIETFAVAGAPGLELRVRVRERTGNAVAVTTTLVNVNEIGRYDLQDAHCFFQVSLRIDTPKGVAALVERPVPVGADDDEVLLNKLLHRHAPTFAVGHGCAADWEWTAPPARGAVLERARPAAVSSVWSAFVPTYEVLLADSNPEFDVPELDMMHLATAADSEVLAGLRRLVEGYRGWIADRRAEAEQLAGTEYAKIAMDQVEECAKVADRIAGGIDELERSADAMKAFRLANEAMAIQRGRTSWIKKGKEEDLVLDGRWRPFQIAFLLLCLRGITDKGHEDREIADVLWFPTGGGKTEAYLGLIAYTVFLRRIREEHGGGVTALMRYTLRLLTLQQFERAAALICAMETLRGKDPTLLGDEKISLGMWVGRAATPNKLKDAATSLRKLKEGQTLQEENPVQLRFCPWCGTPLGPEQYMIDAGHSEMTICCPSEDCEFTDGLPIHVVDDELYRVRPTLIIATSDKFAQIAWRAEVAALFNRDREDGTPPPELIVQDELHLISGPLGTLAGLYETAVDVAANEPKVIASTATIRRAREQGKALFNRRVSQFPPAGLDSRDSWFAVEAKASEKASRLYVGLMTPSTSQATLLIRAYAALLHHAAEIDGEESVRDAYWTLVGYFNSLRLLAAAELQVHDDVQDRLKYLADRAGVEQRPAQIVTELTSRIKSSEVPKLLKALEHRYPDARAFDAVLATNMISVGVDVDRLGLMAVMGQPQTTAEYIQSTSRVGRQHPGLVVTLLNAARSRDRSHYESFISYHSALYRQVESTSVTPFSARARDRALHAVLVGLTRLTVEEMRENLDARLIEEHLDEVEKVRDVIVARAEAVSGENGREVAESTRRELDEIIEKWRDLAESNEELRYEAEYSFKRSEPREPDAALLRTHSDEDLQDAFPTLWSLRDVDVESDLYLERN